jgi:hypothetical protein
MTHLHLGQNLKGRPRPLYLKDLPHAHLRSFVPRSFFTTSLMLIGDLLHE